MGDQGEMHFVDLKDDNNNAAGTIVELTFPV